MEKKEEFGAFLKRLGHPPRVLGIASTERNVFYFRLRVLVFDFPPREKLSSRMLVISCYEAVDFTIRPPNPNTIMGGPPLEFYEQHPLLEDERLQYVPGGDGERYNPPLKFKLLVLDQSRIFATQFEVEEILPK